MKSWPQDAYVMYPAYHTHFDGLCAETCVYRWEVGGEYRALYTRCHDFIG